MSGARWALARGEDHRLAKNEGSIKRCEVVETIRLSPHYHRRFDPLCRKDKREDPWYRDFVSISAKQLGPGLTSDQRVASQISGPSGPAIEQYQCTSSVLFSASARVVGYPALGITSCLPSYIPNLPWAKTKELQFGFVPQKSGPTKRFQT